MTRRFQVVRIDEIPPVPEHSSGDMTWRPVRHYLGIRAFGVNAWEGREPGDLVIEDHTEQTYRHEELYAVVSGRARFTLDGEDVDAPAGTLVYVRPEVRRVAVAEEPRTTVLAIGAQPGHAFEPTAWEVRQTGG
jgi:mannose-6-phosphate isomerase-like protein (cupin superfamily)